jgi:hypothetical protein
MLSARCVLGSSQAFRAATRYLHLETNFNSQRARQSVRKFWVEDEPGAVQFLPETLLPPGETGSIEIYDPIHGNLSCT